MTAKGKNHFSHLYHKFLSCFLLKYPKVLKLNFNWQAKLCEILGSVFREYILTLSYDKLSFACQEMLFCLKYHKILYPGQNKNVLIYISHLAEMCQYQSSMLRQGMDDTATMPQYSHTGAKIDVEVKRASKTVKKWKSNTSACDLALVNGVRQTSGMTDGEAQCIIHWPIWIVSRHVSQVEMTCPLPVSLRVARPLQCLTKNRPFAWPWTHWLSPGGLCVSFRDPSTMYQLFRNSFFSFRYFFLAKIIII